MINPNSILTVLTFDGAFTNQTNKVAELDNKHFTIDLDNSNYIYIGYKKPFTSAYLHLPNGKNNVDTTLKLEYYNGTAWVDLEHVDQTNALNRSSFLTWQTPSDQAENTVNSISKYWIRISSVLALTPNIQVDFVGMVFSDDTDIGLEYPSLLKEVYLPEGKTDFSIYHLTAKNYIMAELLRKGYTKTIDGVKEPINDWDVLSVFELRQASLYYTLSQIFFNLSDNSDDNYWQKYLEYKDKFEKQFNLGLLQIDQDNNGKADEIEKTPIKSYRWVR